MFTIMGNDRKLELDVQHRGWFVPVMDHSAQGMERCDDRAEMHIPLAEAIEFQLSRAHYPHLRGNNCCRSVITHRPSAGPATEIHSAHWGKRVSTTKVLSRPSAD